MGFPLVRPTPAAVASELATEQRQSLAFLHNLKRPDIRVAAGVVEDSLCCSEREGQANALLLE